MRRKVVTLDYSFNKYESKQEYRRYLAKKSIVQFTSDNHKALAQYQRFPYAHKAIDAAHLSQNQARALDWPYKTDYSKSCARIRPFTDRSTSCARSRPYKTKLAITTQSHDGGIIKSSVNDLTQVLINHNQNSKNINLNGRYAETINYKQVHPIEISCARTRPHPTLDTKISRCLGKYMPSISDASQTDIKTCARCKNFNFCKNTSIK